MSWTSASPAPRRRHAFPLVLVGVVWLPFCTSFFHSVAKTPPVSLAGRRQASSLPLSPWRPLCSVPEGMEPPPSSPSTVPTGLQRRYSTWKWRGYDINYRVEGDPKDPNVLLIHGFGASVNHFRRQFEYLPSQGYRVHSIDMLGYGASDKPGDVDYELELWRDQLVDYMEQVVEEGGGREGAKWVVCGNSIGGLLSLMVADARGPDRVQGVCMFNSAGGLTSFRDEELPWFLRPLWVFVRTVLFGERFGPGLFQRFRTEENVRQVLSQVYGNKEAVDDELVNVLLAPGQDEGAQTVFLKILRAPAGPSPESLLPRIQVPVIAIWGEDDPWTPLTTGMHPGIKFPQYNPAVKLYPLPQTGHCPMDERPQEVHAILLPFLHQVFKKAASSSSPTAACQEEAVGGGSVPPSSPPPAAA